MSTRKGGTTKGPPAHQNATTWQPKRAVKKSEKELGGKLKPYPAVDGVCIRCKEQIEWRRKYGKYKPINEPAKCIRCSKRAVRQAYLTLCPACAKEGNVCAKCCKPAEALVTNNAAQEAEDRQRLAQALEGLRERERRTLLRAMAKGGNVGSTADQAEKLKEAREARANGDDDDDDDEDLELSDAVEVGEGGEEDESDNDGEDEGEGDDEMGDKNADPMLKASKGIKERSG
eukprot:TRINITY_DN221_c0_g1_i1.p1 TRINITY_DN221_c0_g1~~TRINITY_DN221_c0_g1_i1.p1  ORF type:complete len:231 (-),score=49.09 TRINITY_DN221_c0_g1_i1:323-1015(-)